jgi:uncharacterized protein with PIN domain
LDILIVFLIVAAGLALAFTWSSRCPKCRRFLALRFTDAEREVRKLGVAVKQREVVCRHCGHRLWRDRQDGDSSPGGGGP